MLAIYPLILYILGGGLFCYSISSSTYKICSFLLRIGNWDGQWPSKKQSTHHLAETCLLLCPTSSSSGVDLTIQNYKNYFGSERVQMQCLKGSEYSALSQATMLLSSLWAIGEKTWLDPHLSFEVCSHSVRGNYRQNPLRSSLGSIPVEHWWVLVQLSESGATQQ